MREPKWLTIDAVIYMNQVATTDTNEPHEILDKGLLESAVARAQNHYAYP